MSGLKVIFLNFIKLALRKKIRFLVLFILPVVCFLLMFLLFASPSRGGISLGVLNEDSGSTGDDLCQFLARSGYNKLSALEPGEAGVLLKTGKISLALFLPPDFSARLRRGESPQVRIASREGELVGAALEPVIRQFCGNVAMLGKAAEEDDALFTGLYSEYQAGDARLKVSELPDAALRQEGIRRGIGFLLFFILLQALFVANLILEDKEEGTLSRIRTAPLRLSVYITGNALASFLLLSCQTLLTLGSVVFLFRLPLAVPLWKVIPLLLVFNFMAVSLGLMITTMASSSIQAVLILNLVVIPSSMLSGSFFPIELMSPGLRKVSGLFPQKWFLQAFSALQEGASLGQMGSFFLLLAGFGLFFLLVALFKLQDRKML